MNSVPRFGCDFSTAVGETVVSLIWWLNGELGKLTPIVFAPQTTQPLQETLHVQNHFRTLF